MLINGEILIKDEANISSFFWNDPLLISDTVWFGFGGIPLFKEKIDQLIHQMQNLGALVPDLFLNQREFFRRIKRMLNKNRFYRSGLINIHIHISNSETNYTFYATPFEQTEFRYHEKGSLIAFSEIKKYSNSLIQIDAVRSRFIVQLAEAKNNDPLIHKLVFLNEKGVVCDAGMANIFLIRRNLLITPSPETGCISDNLRNLLLEAAKNIGLQINETDDIPPESCFKMDEIFFASESTGIHWVLGIETKRFVHQVSAKIHKELNEILKRKVN